MNNGKLCGLVVLLCVICPIMVGYVWPVGTTDEKGWEAGDPINISNDLINSEIDVFTPYDDPYNNNQNVFNSQRFANHPVVSTSSSGPVWDATLPYLNSQSVMTDENGEYTILRLDLWQDWTDYKAVVFSKTGGWNEIIIKSDNSSVDLVVFYPETKQIFYRTLDGSFHSTTELALTFKASALTTKSIYYMTYDTRNYADLNYGFNVPSLESTWVNGYINKAASILFDTPDDSIVYLEFIDLNQNYNYSVTISVDSSGSIYLYVFENSTQIYYELLGNNDAYDKVLLSYDYDNKSISLSGLRGLNSFIGDYQGAIRDTITCNLDHPIIFYSFNIDEVQGDVSWYVAGTISGVSSTSGTTDYYLKMRDYSPTGSLQINLRSVQIHSDRFDIVVNSTVYRGTFEGNMLTIETDGEDLKVPINNLLIGLIENKVYLNGYLIADPGSFISSAQLRFYDDWLMSVYLYHMEEIDITGYTWMPGSFGLDAMGFCSVGLITSFGSALTLGLYGRRSGVRLGLVTMTALFCAAAYLIFMMGGSL